jgi:hypothetical protein
MRIFTGPETYPAEADGCASPGTDEHERGAIGAAARPCAAAEDEHRMVPRAEQVYGRGGRSLTQPT